MSMKTEFTQLEKEMLKYYVYCLVDPKDNKIFYVGKGKDNRVFEHARDAINSNDTNLKLDKIREIRNRENPDENHVKYYILRYGIENENVAYTIESTVIDLLTYPLFNRANMLTNIDSGHHQWDEGIKTIDELSQIYDCQKLKMEDIKHNLLLVSLNQTYIQKNAEGIYKRSDIYECTRKYWTISLKNAKDVEYVLGIYKGIVRAVLRPDLNENGEAKWMIAKFDDNGNPFKSKRDRFQIEGSMDDKEGNSLYLNKDVSDFPFGIGGSFRYLKPQKN